MIFRRAGILSVLILTLGLALMGCDSAEKRAEAHFQSGMALLEAGDVDRAMVEFRNVFKLNGHHKEARLVYARLQRERGQMQEAYSQYLRLVEQYPDDLEGRRALAEMAIQRQDWPEVERHARAARTLAPNDPLVIAMNAALDYHTALLREDAAAATQAVATARRVLTPAGGEIIARQIVIDQLMRAQDWPGAKAEIDIALAQDTTDLALHGLKIQTLAMLQDQPGIGAHLQKMVELFPENQPTRDALISWYVESGDLAGAEAFLRSLTKTKPDPTNPDNPAAVEQANVAVVQFLFQTRGAAAARAELDRLIAAGQNPALYRSLRAAADFEAGDTAHAIAEMEAILQNAPPTEQTHNIKIGLATMLEATGNHVGARARAEEILAEDPTHVAALRMRAASLINEDRPGEAITVLRTALDQDPRDPATLTLMAQAHLRDGSRELAGERLALAVEVSNQRAAESLRYGRFLVDGNRLAVAETVLIDALRRAPDNIDLLRALADIYLRQADWPRTQGIIRQLQQIGTDPARSNANRLQLELLYRQQKIDESVAFLQALADQNDNALDLSTEIVRTHMRNNDPTKALKALETLLAEHPDDGRLRFLRAGLHALAGEVAKAEAIYRTLIAESPTDTKPVQALYMLLNAANRPAEAAAVLEAGLAASNNSPGLVFLKAGLLEAQGDFNGAIALYEELYALNSDNVVLANNLASLLATHHEDPESLNRAFALAQRLRGTDLPPFQDTYGWIEYRRGNYEEALANLKPAAAGLPDDPLAQLHLGLTYAALKQTEAARKTLIQGLKIAGDSNLPLVTTARETLKGLSPGP